MPMELTDKEKSQIEKMHLTPYQLGRILQIRDQYMLPNRGGYDGEETGLGAELKPINPVNHTGGELRINWDASP